MFKNHCFLKKSIILFSLFLFKIKFFLFITIKKIVDYRFFISSIHPFLIKLLEKNKLKRYHILILIFSYLLISESVKYFFFLLLVNFFLQFLFNIIIR